MMMNILGQTYQAWNGWNHKIEGFTNQVVLSTAKRLPISYDPLFIKYRTEIKVMLLGLTFFVLLSASLSMPYLSIGNRFVASVVVIGLVAQPFFSNLSICARRINSVVPAGSNISSLWSSIYSKVTNAIKHLTLQPEIDQIDQDVKEDIENLLPKIRELKRRIKTFDRFILERPELLNLAKRYLQEDKDFIWIGLNNRPDFRARKFDLNNPIHRLCQLGKKSIRLDYLWDKRLRFIRRHPVLRDKIIAYMELTARETPKVSKLLE